jgi:iron complex outermembrane receptor protein
MDTVDLDVQHDFRLASDRHHIVWGFGIRRSDDRVRNLPTQAFLPAEFTHRLWGAFVQDDIQLVPQRWKLTLGTRIEHTNYSGTDHQPNLRVTWLAAPHQTFWGAISRAVRTPSRADRDLFIPPRTPFTVAGGPNFGSESLVAFELGWRGRIRERTSISLTGFAHDYDDLRTLELPVPLQFDNGLEARTHGVELFWRHDPVEWMHWSFGYTLLKKDFRLKPWSRDLNAGTVEQADPERQFQIRTAMDLPRGWELDLGLRHASPVPTFANGIRNLVPAYAELDARLGWLNGRGLEISLVGTNLLDRAHPETGPANNRLEIQRSVHGRFIWRF